MTIFLAGVHGVGKTYLAGPAASKLGVRHATASQLIKEERGLQTWGVDKNVSQVDVNQVALISAVARIKNLGKGLLLDGHLVLRMAPDKHVRLGTDIFRDLQIRAIILLEAPPEKILERLQARGDYTWNIPSIAALASDESEHAAFISKELQVPLIVLSEPPSEEFVESIKAIVTQQ